MNRGALVASLALALVATGRDASAHTVGLSSGEYAVRGMRLEAKLVFARGELARLCPLLDENRDGHVSPAEVTSARPQLRARVVERIVVTAAGARCEPTLTDAAITEGDGLFVAARWQCGASPPDRAELALLEDLGSSHRHVARLSVVGAETPSDRVLGEEGKRVLELGTGAPAPSSPVSPPSHGRSFLVLGIEHVLGGADHLLFLLALVLVPATARALVRTVTAFTLAHSVTLALAALGIVAPSPRLVEPAIALSIAWVAAENLRAPRPEQRWRVTAAFGFVHGFGFASALREVGLPRARAASSLLAFNVGVEVAQLLVLAALVPILVVLRRRTAFEPRFARAVSIGLVAVGGAWFVARLLGLDV